jgi:hypothetical protein
MVEEDCKREMEVNNEKRKEGTKEMEKEGT